jgi:quinoprotein glucose dehydrogenase
MRSRVRLACSLALSIGATVLAAQPPHRPTTALGEWPTYGGDLASSHYSPLDHIRKDNFATLRVAWRAITPDATLSMTLADGSEWTAGARAVFDDLIRRDPKRWRDAQPPFINNFKATPLMVGGVLYLNTPLSIGAAFDARTGAMRWVYNPKSYEAGTTSMTLRWNQRGVAYWTDGTTDRVFWGTGDGYLLSVDAKTGLPSPGFGENGRIDLMQGLPRARRGERDYLNALTYSVQSPPLVVGDIVIAPASISSLVNKKEQIPGWIRAYAAMDLQDRACRGRLRLRNVAARHGRSERQGDGVDDDERR